jgi:hypothetical protein
MSEHQIERVQQRFGTHRDDILSDLQKRWHQQVRKSLQEKLPIAAPRLLLLLSAGLVNLVIHGAHKIYTSMTEPEPASLAVDIAF